MTIDRRRSGRAKVFFVIFHDHRPATVRSVPSRSRQNVLCIFFMTIDRRRSGRAKMFSVIFHDHRPATIRSVPSRSSQNVLCVFFFHDHRAATIWSSQNVLCDFFMTIDRRRSGRCHLGRAKMFSVFFMTIDRRRSGRAKMFSVIFHDHRPATVRSVPSRSRQNVLCDFS